MAFAGNMVAPRKRIANDEYDHWLGELPDDERAAIEGALRNPKGWPHAELKARLEGDPDRPAPEFSLTVFRGWRNAHVVR